MKYKNGRILGTIIIIIFFPILIINLMLIIKSHLNPNEAPNVFGYKPFIVLSGSMEPTIMTGDIAIIKSCNIEKLKVGDIIAYRSGTSVITHRITAIEVKDGTKEFVTKGDNNNKEDRYPIDESKIEGLFVKRIAKLGNLAMFLQTTTGAVLCISIPFILFILTDVMQKNSENKTYLEKQKRLEQEIEKLKKEKIT